MTRIAVLGTGLMGAPMARRLLGAGFEVTVWNRTRAKAEALVVDGATVAATPREAAREADVILTMLENGDVVGEVLFGPDGAAEGLKPGAIVLDMSSIPPATAREHAAKLQALGAAHVDAPVSGGTRGAAAGTLAIMAGGAEETIAGLAPVFAPLGRALRVGPSGSGQLAKLANQVIVGVTIGAVSEALLLAAAGGADPAAVREAIRGGFAESRVLAEHGLRMVERDFLPGAPSRVQLKDLDTALAAARESGAALPLSENVRARYAELIGAMGGAEYDHAALLLELEARTGKRLTPGPDRLPG